MTSKEKYINQRARNHFCYGQYCSNCHHDMFDHESVTDEVASNEFMSSCPWCHRTWLD